MKLPKELGISQLWLQSFVDQAMLWTDDRELRRYVRFLTENGLAPKPSGRAENEPWSLALINAQNNFSIDVLEYLQLTPVTEGGSSELVEREDIPEEHWKDLYIGLRGTYRALIGDEPYGLRRIPITVAIGLFEQALRAESALVIPSKYALVAEPKPLMSKNALLAEGLITPEESKPEWLRGLNGVSAPVAHWFPADKDGNAIE